MKNKLKMLGLALMLPICCFGNPSIPSAQKTIVYIIEKSSSKPNTLTIRLNRTDKSSTRIALRNSSMGISKQVKNMVCDGKPLMENQPGIWTVPSDCQKLQWQVPLLESGVEIASAQQSIKVGNFILFSEISSLPRLQDAGVSEILKVEIPNVKKIFPLPNDSGEITLPNIHSAPFFVLINPTEVGTDSLDLITLTYLLDNSEAISKLPNRYSHILGLQWLNTVLSGKEKQDFTLAWLGISAKRLSLAGAAGNNILLTNYPNDSESAFGKSVLLYVALHEAFHQFVMKYSDQPGWISESLASYYGIRALHVALPNDPAPSALMERFQKDGNRFSDGLLIINRQVKNGDRSQYGAFYTKGITFWAAVDSALKQIRGDSLDNHLLEILQTNYNAQNELADLQKVLNLPSEIWISLCDRFLN